MKYVYVYILGAMLFFNTACRDKPTFSILPDGQKFEGAPSSKVVSNKVDILFVIDNSTSMGDNQKKLAENFGAFISNFSKLGYDFQIAVVTSDAYVAKFKPNEVDKALFKDGFKTSHSGVFVITPSTANLEQTFLTNVTQGAGGYSDERPFQSFKTALDYTPNAGFVRPDSYLAIVILSDEDDFSGETREPGQGGDHHYDDPRIDSVDSYVTYLNGITGSTASNLRYSVSAIVMQDKVTCPKGFIPGTRIMELATKTGGQIGNVCDANYLEALNKIQVTITEQSSVYRLDRTPDQSTIVVKIGGTVIPKDDANGWSYDEQQNAIKFHGSSTPATNSSIEVAFTPSTPKI